MFMRYFMGCHIVFNKHQCSSVTIHAKCGRTTVMGDGHSQSQEVPHFGGLGTELKANAVSKRSRTRRQPQASSMRRPGTACSKAAWPCEASSHRPAL